MTDELDRLALAARATVQSGYYRVGPEGTPSRTRLTHHLKDPEGSRIVAEIKPASPTAGTLRAGADAGSLAQAFAKAGAAGISVLTEPHRFGGSLRNLAAATAAGAPVLFKDFVVSRDQLDAAARGGAAAVLLILDLFERGHADLCVESAIAAAHDRGLETILEVYDEDGYLAARETATDIVGVNNRDLRTLHVDPYRAELLLAEHGKDRPVMALSGVETAEDVRRQMTAGADGVLVGSALMKAPDPALKLTELTRWRST
ncbi:MAG TPA: indole-3-glycerol-phosphate synthase [Candidatus Thermoplasmatota archaeon]|nr:indole-3-glycerol-phosphate synthase [Candidatus Thermoplasmatota archaeon]